MSRLFFAAAAAAVLCVTAGTALAADYDPPFPPLVVTGDQTRLVYPEFPVEVVVSEAETGGQFGIAILYHKPNEGSPERGLLEGKLTETFYVLEGNFRFFVGDDTYEGGPGTVVVNPPKVPHSVTNIGPGIGKVLVLYTPVDIGPMKGTDFFVQWATQSTRTPEWIARTNAEYGIDRPAP